MDCHFATVLNRFMFIFRKKVTKIFIFLIKKWQISFRDFHKHISREMILKMLNFHTKILIYLIFTKISHVFIRPINITFVYPNWFKKYSTSPTQEPRWAPRVQITTYAPTLPSLLSYRLGLMKFFFWEPVSLIYHYHFL